MKSCWIRSAAIAAAILVELAGNGRIAIAGDEPQPTREGAQPGLLYVVVVG